MIDRIFTTLVIMGGLTLLWLTWKYYKCQMVQSIETTTTYEKPALLYFTGEYCVTCKFQQTPVIQELLDAFGDQVQIETYDVTAHSDLAQQYKVLTLPTTVIVNRDGQVADINYGLASRQKLVGQLDQLNSTSSLMRPLPRAC